MRTRTVLPSRRSALALAALAVGLLVAAGAPSPARTQAAAVTVIPFEVTGPPTQRLNMIVFGDGYREEELAKFHADVDKHMNVLWSIEPYRSYRNYFNIYMVDTPSAVSGISCDPDDGNVRRDTPLGLQFANTCPADPLARGITYSSAGNAARTAILNTYVGPALGIPGNAQNIQTLALANTFTYGGIGGTHATTSGSSPQGPLITPHELGHSTGTLADEYPYSSREIPGGPAPNTEPGSLHHSRLTEAQMIAQQAKWFRWLCEESESGGIITARESTCGPPHEGGNTRSSNIWRPSEHSIMRWLGNHFDQVGREHMTYRITGLRNANAMPLTHTPLGQVGPNDVVWVETTHPKLHELTVTWRINGAVVTDTFNSRNLVLAGRGVQAGDVVQVTVQDPTPFVRDPAFKNGPRMTQTRQWTVGAPLPAAPVDVVFTSSTQTEQAVNGREVVFVETPHPNDRVLQVAWRLDGALLPNLQNSRNLDLGALGLAPGTYALTATVTDPAAPGGASETRTWTVDNVLPTAPRTLSEPLTRLAGPLEHGVYFNEFSMKLDPQDDQPGFVVGEFRLDHDGWFNYFGFPEQPLGSPFVFSHSGKSVKALTYGNLGTGGLSKATFEQSFPGFEPGFGTHTVEHQAIDAAGNIGDAVAFKATVLPGGSPACTTTLLGGRVTRLQVTSGVTCVVGGTLSGGVTVRGGGSLVAFDGTTINGGLRASGATVVHLFGTRVNGDSQIAGTTDDLILAGSRVNGSLTLSDNHSADVTIPSGATRNYGIALVGNTITEDLVCTSNVPGVTDFGAPNSVGGLKSGQCAGL